jgi:TonB family protein
MKPFLNNVTKITACLAVVLLFASKVEAQKQVTTKHSKKVFASNKEQKLVRLEQKISLLTNLIGEAIRYQTPAVNDRFVPVLASYSVSSESNGTVYNRKVREEKKALSINDAQTFKNWLTKNLELKLGGLGKSTSGKVTVKFAIDENGNLTNAKILNSTDSDVNEAILDILSKSPQWKMKKLQEQPYKLYYSITIKYDLI